MSAIKPSIVARLKPELVPVRTRREINEMGRATGVFYWQPLEYKDQTLNLLHGENAMPYDTAEIGNVIAQVVTRTAQVLTCKANGDSVVKIEILVQFRHKIELWKKHT